MSSHWKNKLLEWEAAPPPSAWDGIANRLDDAQPAFPKKLFDYTEAPPPHAWPRIEDQLAPQTTKISFLPKKLIRYAAAAILVLALAGVAYVTLSDHNRPAVARQTALPSAPAVAPAKREIKHFNVPPQPASAALAAEQIAKKEPAVNLKATKKQPARRPATANLPLEPLFATELDVVPEEKTIVDADRADRYMIATSAEGAAVRLPKKVYSAFACPDEAPRRQACELQRSLLQQKISSSFTTDFAHFLDLLKNLQEN